MEDVMTESPIFEIRITTCATGTILRAPTEREVAAKAEHLLRRFSARGEWVAFSIAGPGTAATARLTAYLEEVLMEVAKLSI